MSKTSKYFLWKLQWELLTVKALPVAVALVLVSLMKTESFSKDTFFYVNDCLLGLMWE